MAYIEELDLMLESIESGRMTIEQIKRKDLHPNKVKYTIILLDTAIPSKKIKRKAKKEPKTPIIIQPVAPTKPPMADITPIGYY